MKYCLISVAVCFMPLPSLAFTDIYSELPDVAGVSKVAACSGFFPDSCLSIKKQNSLGVVYPKLFNNRVLVGTPDNNLQLIIHQDNTGQHSLHFVYNPKSKSASQEKLSSYFRNLKRIAMSNVRIKYTPVNNALTFIHLEAPVVITVDGFYSDLSQKAVISTMLSEKTIAVMSIVAEAISSYVAFNPDIVLSTNKNSDRIPESDKGAFLEACEGHYVFHPHPEFLHSSPDYRLSHESVTIGSEKFENKAYEYSLGDAYKLSFLNFGQAVIKPIGDARNEGEPADGKNRQHKKKEKSKSDSGASGTSTSQQQGQHGSGAGGAAGASSGGGGKRPPRKKADQKKHISEDYNAPEQAAEEIDKEIQSIVNRLAELNERLVLCRPRNRGAQEPADTLPDAPEGATGGTGNKDHPATLRLEIQELNNKLLLAHQRKREFESKARATPGAPKGNESGASTSRRERRPQLGHRRFLSDDYDDPYSDSR